MEFVLKKNEKEAIKYIKKAADMGDVEAIAVYNDINSKKKKKIMNWSIPLILIILIIFFITQKNFSFKFK